MTELARLEAVELKEYWADEAKDFTPWLFKEENLVVLSEALNMELVPVSTEKSVGPFRADIVCRVANGDPDDDSEAHSDSKSVILIENQLTRSNHKHLGQLLTYAAGLDAGTIVWIAKTFADEHRAALEWLNSITDQRFRFFGVEVQLWKIGDSVAAPKFEVVSQPNDWALETRRLEEGAASNVEILRSRYWTGLAEYMEEDDHRLVIQLPRTGYVVGFAMGRNGFRLQAWISMHIEHRIAVRLRIAQNDWFQRLLKQKDEIQREVGESLEWEQQEGVQRCYIIAKHPTADPSDESTWRKQHVWMAAMLGKFYDAFHPRVQRV